MTSIESSRIMASACAVTPDSFRKMLPAQLHDSPSTMGEAWPAFCTLAGLLLLLVVIIRWRLNAFVALLVASIGIGLAAGMSPIVVARTVHNESYGNVT